MDVRFIQLAKPLPNLPQLLRSRVEHNHIFETTLQANHRSKDRNDRVEYLSCSAND